jgi:hypothetical protein
VDAGTGAECDPCTDGTPVLGPETFARSCAAPHRETRDLALEADGELCFLVTSFGTASAWIKLDGETVLGPAAFNPHVTTITARAAATAGTHEVTIRLASAPGSRLTLEVRACGAEPPDPPDLPLCSEVASAWCAAKGWVVADSSPYPGNIICTLPGVAEDENCSGCGEYNIVVWESGSGDRFCPVTYTTVAGKYYCGHDPCECGDNLVLCGSWDPAGCIQD